MKYFRSLLYVIECLLVLFFLLILKLVGMRIAAKIGAVIVSFVGKRHSAHNIAYGNLNRAMPDLSHEERVRLLDRVWQGLGMTFGEFVHVGLMNKRQINKVVTIDDKSKQLYDEMVSRQKSGRGGIITSAHFGNWEAGLRYLQENGLEISALYRPLNNPYANIVMEKVRGGANIAKGRDGLKEMIRRVKKGSYVIILADQKVTGGVPVRFFHDDAITTTSIAKIVEKYDVDLKMAKTLRRGNSSKFDISIEELSEKEVDDCKRLDFTSSLTSLITKKIENWVCKDPEQWFWVHNRWKK